MQKICYFFESFIVYLYLMNEKELVAKAQSGDFEAFSELINANKSKIYALGLKMTGNQHDAEDIVSETLVKAIDNIDKFRGESAFGTWLYTIALNQARALFAKQKQVDLKPIDEYLPTKKADDLHSSSGFKIFDWEDPHKRLESAELKRIINEAIGQLPAKYREVFILRYLEELSIKEIAKLIHESEASTKSRVLRAKLALRDYLSGRFEEQYGQKMS